MIGCALALFGTGCAMPSQPDEGGAGTPDPSAKAHHGKPTAYSDDVAVVPGLCYW